MTRLRVACDVGGTFTDICVLDEDTGVISVAKVPSTPADPIDAVIDGVRTAANVDLRDVTVFSHGSTVATNALITRTFPRAAMVTTTGFRDVIEIRRGTKEDLWDAYKDVPPPYIRRRDRFEVDERVGYDGELLEPVDDAGARKVAAVLRKRGVEAVAVCFVNSYANPENELRMRAILEEELPGVAISTSSEVLPEIFEHERFSTTVANAVLSPLIGGYVQRLQSRLEAGGYDGDVLLLHSGGGVMTPKTAEKLAVRLASSGIAAGAIASRHIAMLCGYPNSIGLDMGGTSTDISLVYQGQERITKEWFVEYGYPICFPSIEVLTIGAGGGSLAWIDGAGSLRNGPQSAGANPGPACYQRGNDQATNTDANVVLGRLGSELIGGAMTLDAGAAAERARGARRQGRPRARGGRQGGHPGREREHGRHRPPDLDPPRLRPARVRARRLRRRGRAARCRSRARAVDPDRDRPAQPRHHLGARLPARRRPPRHHRDVPARRSRPSIRPRSRARSSGSRSEARERARRRGRPARADEPAAADRHALPRPVALALGARRGAARPGAGGRDVPRRAPAGVQLPPRRRARSRSTA